MSRRGWTVGNERLGPGTAIRPRLTRRGIGGSYAVIGNPVSFTLDPVLGCLPWLSLRGGTDAQSNALRDALNTQDTQGQQDSTSFTLPFDPTGPGAVPTTNSNPPTGGNTGGTQGNPSTPAGPGPFGYIPASKTGRR